MKHTPNKNRSSKQRPPSSETDTRRVNSKRLILIAGISLAVGLAIVWALRWRITTTSEPEQVLKIGAVLPQSGPGGVFAQYIQEGIDLAVEELNKEGHPQVRVFYEDSKNQPREALTVYNKLVSTDKPPVVIVALSSVAKALAPLAEQSQTAQVYIAVAIPDITDGKYTFRVYPEANGMAGVMARFNSQRLNAKTSAVIYINDDFGRVSLDAYRRETELHGGSVVFADSYELQQTDFRPLISKLMNLTPAPDVIYLNGYGPSYGAFIKQLKEQRLSVQLTADMTMGLPNTLEQVGEAGDGVYFVDGKISQPFTESFKRKYSKEPSSYAGYAYDIVRLLHKSAKEKNGFAVENLRSGLLEVKDYPGAMGVITIQPNGDSNLEFVVKRVLNENGTPAIQ